MFDSSAPKYFSGILLNQNSMKFQKINDPLFPNEQVTYISLFKWTQ